MLAHFFLLKINFHCRISMPDLIFGFGITWRWIHTDLFVIPYWVGCISHIIRYFIRISKYDSAVKIELSDLFICLGWLIFLINGIPIYLIVRKYLVASSYFICKIIYVHTKNMRFIQKILTLWQKLIPSFPVLYRYYHKQCYFFTM